MKTKLYRHGEIALEPISKLPDNLTQSDTKILISGSHGNNHEIDNGKIYFKKEDSYVFGYLVAKNTSILHSEHGEEGGKIKKAYIPDGVYPLRKQQEFVNNELKPIVD